MTSPQRPRRLASPAALIAAGLAPEARRAELEAVAARYAVAVTPALAALIDRADPDDPIGDDAKSPIKGLVHRYPDRVLLKLVAVCAVYCRFCFRRERVGPGGEAMSPAEMQAALAYIRARPAIWEVVLTGGDPLMLSPRRIAETSAAFAAIDHLKVLRWHTRLAVAAPERVTKAMARALRPSGGKTAVVAIHANHAREITPAARAAFRRLAIPNYVLDIPGAYGKIPIGPQSIRADGPGRYVVTDPDGGEHVYVDHLEGLATTSPPRP